MVHGHQDYGGAAPTATVYTIQDIAELAARLSSIDRFDRRGNVLWMDGFEDGFNKWGVTLSGSGAAATVTAQYAKSGINSLYIVGGSTGYRYVDLAHYEPYVQLSKMGFEIGWSYASDVEHLDFFIYVYDGTTAHQGIITYYPAAFTWYYIDSSYNLQSFLTNFEHRLIKSLFNVTKLVIDPVTDKYVRVIINNQEVDLSAYDLYTIADNTLPSVMLAFDVNSDAGKNGECYADDAIYTINEP